MLVNGALIPLSAFLDRTVLARAFYSLLPCFYSPSGTFICGIAPNFPVIFTGRLIQAAGGGILQPLITTIHSFHLPSGNARERDGNLWTCHYVCPCNRPALSGWVIQEYSWRSHVLRNGAIRHDGHDTRLFKYA